MPDRERARVLAVIMGCVVIGMLYALGGLSLYLRARFLGPSPTPFPAAFERPTQAPLITVALPTREPTSAQAQQPVATLALSTPTLVPTATLYPTITPNLTATHLASGETLATPTTTPPTAPPTPFSSPTEPPTVTPTAAPTLTPAPTETPSPLPTETEILVLRPTRANQ
jgi:hypothetical protein